MHIEMLSKKLTTAQVREWRIRSILFGLSIPMLAAIVLFPLKYQEIRWWYSDTSVLQITQGTIESSSIDYRPGWRSDGWYFAITYKYEVAQQSYSSNRVHYGPAGSTDKSYAEQYVTKYPTGSNVNVYYNPEHPETSVLDPAIKDYSFLYFIAGTIAFGFCFVALSFWIR